MNFKLSKLLYLAILISFIGFGCSKECDVVYKGSVSDYYTHSAVSGVTVKLQKQKVSLFGSLLKYVSSTTTDNSGNFAFTFRTEEGYIYSAGIDMTDDYQPINEYSLNEKNAAHIKIKRFIPIQVHVIDSSHKAQIITVYTSDNINTFSSKNINAMNVDTIITLKAIPDHTNSISALTANNGRLLVSKTIRVYCDSTNNNKASIKF